MADTICNYDVSIESPLLIKILKQHKAVPKEGLEDNGTSLFVEEGQFNFSFYEGYASINKPIKNLDSFLEAFIQGTKMGLSSNKMKPFLSARDEIKNRLREIKNDIITASCYFSIEAFFADDDTGLSIYEAMSEKDAQKFNKGEDERILSYEFSTEYSYDRGKEKFDYSYDFDFQ